MCRKAVWNAVVMAVAVSLPSTVSAQVQTMKDFQVADAQDMGEKVAALGGAFDASHLDWRPMEGVRSVKDVLALAVADQLVPS